MTSKIILTTIVDQDYTIDREKEVHARFKSSSDWARLNINDCIQMPLNNLLDMNIEGFVLHQIGTVGGPDWWSGFNDTNYTDGKKHLNVVECLPIKLMKRIRDKTAMVHYDQSLEAFPMVTRDCNYYKSYYTNFKKFALPPEQFIYTTCNLVEEETHAKWCNENDIPEGSRMIIIASNFFAASSASPFFFGSESDSITVEEHLQYKETYDITLYNCLNRVIREHRVALSAMLNYYDLIEGHRISQNVFPKHFSTTIRMNQFNDHPAFDEANVIDIYSKLPLVLDTDQFQINKAQHFFKELYLQTYINVITETFYSEYNGDAMFFSEKIFKPMRARQPFILVGAPGSIKALRDEGFKTFDKWFDESYSDIEDDTTRLNAICNLLLELNKKTKQEWCTMYMEMQEVLDHNYTLLMTNDWLSKFRTVLKDRIPHD